jgi:hypothetical protein
MRAMRRRFREIRGNAGWPGNRRRTEQADTLRRACLACTANPVGTFDGGTFASEVCLLAIPEVVVARTPGFGVCGSSTGPQTSRGPQDRGSALPSFGALCCLSLPLGFARDIPFGFSQQLARLGHILDRFFNQRIVHQSNLASLCLTVNELDQGGSDAGPDKV